MNKAQHKKAVQSAATAFVNSTETLAKAVAAAQRDGVTSDEIREWLSGIVNSGNLSRVLIAAFGDGARKRGKRSDAGKSPADQHAKDFGDLLADCFRQPKPGPTPGASEPLRDVNAIIELITKRAKYKGPNAEKQIAALLRKIVAELDKRLKAAK